MKSSASPTERMPMKKPSRKSWLTNLRGSETSVSPSPSKPGKEIATVSEQWEALSGGKSKQKDKEKAALLGTKKKVKVLTPYGAEVIYGTTPKKKINSRQKGAAGEREFAQVLKDAGVAARRGQQFAGGADSPDVISDFTDVHFEVKRTEKTDLYAWLKQASDDAGDNLPVVVHRKNRGGWVALVDWDDMLMLLTVREGTLI